MQGPLRHLVSGETRPERRSQVNNRDRCAASCRWPRPRAIGCPSLPRPLAAHPSRWVGDDQSAPARLLVRCRRLLARRLRTGARRRRWLARIVLRHRSIPYEDGCKNRIRHRDSTHGSPPCFRFEDLHRLVRWRSLAFHNVGLVHVRSPSVVNRDPPISAQSACRRTARQIRGET